MIKLLGCVLLIITGAMTGNSISSSMENRLTNVKMISSMLTDIRIMLYSEFMPTAEIIAKLSCDQRYVKADFLHMSEASYTGGSLAENISDSTLDIPDELREKLCAYFRRFGTTDAESQLALIDILISDTNGICSEIYDHTKKIAPLSRKLGVLGGAAAAVLII